MRLFSQRTKHMAALAAVVGALAAFPGMASAASCDYNGTGPNMPSDPSLVDGGGFSWDVVPENGGIGDGYNDASDRHDAFDTMGQLYVSADGGASFKQYANPNTTGCTLEENGREVVFPDDTATVTGLKLARRVYVPSSGLAFARQVDVLMNTGGATRTVLYRWGGNLGSDGGSRVAGTSNGDLVISQADSWANTFEAPLTATSDVLATMVWDGTSRPVQRAAKAGGFDPSQPGYAVPVDSEDIGAEYSVTLAPGQTKRFMHALALRLTLGEQSQAASAIAAEPNELFAGLSAAEIVNIQNWSSDRDGDGVENATDNCGTLPNPGQEDLDGDRAGDACDPDIDGDGLANSSEAAIGTDPRKVDSDGDGRTDNADSCPTLAGATDSGCPAPVVAQQSGGQPVDRTAPVTAVAVAKRVSLKALLRRGLAFKASSNEPASLTVEIVAAARGAKLAKVGDLVISAKALGAGSGTRSVKLKIARKWRKALSTRSRLTLRVVATDASGNRAAVAKRLRLEK